MAGNKQRSRYRAKQNGKLFGGCKRKGKLVEKLCQKEEKSIKENQAPLSEKTDVSDSGQ